MSSMTTVVTVMSVSEGQRLDCCDEDTAHVWVRVTAWSPRRAFLTGAAPFVAAAGAPASTLAGKRFLAELDLYDPPGNDDTSGERLDWPGLRLAPELPEDWTAPVSASGAVTAASLLPVGGREFDKERAKRLVAAMAPGVRAYRMLTLDGIPESKSRPRFDSKSGRTYKASADEAAETKTATLMRRSFPRPVRGNLAVAMVFFRPNRQRIDVDNLAKHVLDAGNSIAWFDDAQVTAQYGVVELDAEDPRTLVVVTRHVSSLDRAGVLAKVPKPRRRGARS